jgi:hypothetical protein
MSKQQVEIFMPPNKLKAKVGEGGGLDLNAVKRAEAAIEDLKDEFAEWIAADVESLSVAHDVYRDDPSPQNLGVLYRAAHDLKGQATTFEFPLVARVAASLCKMTDDDGENNIKPTAPGPLLAAHVDAIKVILRQKITDPSDKMATVLAGELERQVTVFLAKATPTAR